jgi:hypothetical protein
MSSSKEGSAGRARTYRQKSHRGCTYCKYVGGEGVNFRSVRRKCGEGWVCLMAYK